MHTKLMMTSTQINKATHNKSMAIKASDCAGRNVVYILRRFFLSSSYYYYTSSFRAALHKHTSLLSNRAQKIDETTAKNSVASNKQAGNVPHSEFVFISFLLPLSSELSRLDWHFRLMYASKP